MAIPGTTGSQRETDATRRQRAAIAAIRAAERDGDSFLAGTWRRHLAFLQDIERLTLGVRYSAHSLPAPKLAKLVA